jgi:hypothetical protein
MAAILEAIPAPQLAPATKGTILVCDQAMSASALAEGRAPHVAEPALYARLAASVLRHGYLEVILHLRRRSAEAAAIRRAIEEDGELLPDCHARLRVIGGGPLAAVLPGADLLVSFASPALIEGCRSGLKPIQIGAAVAGSAAFTHIFPDVDSFADALASGDLIGRLSVREYEQFEEFCRQLCAGTRRAAWRLGGDPIVRACRKSESPRVSSIRKIASALANPVAAWRLVRGNFGKTGQP